ncbi:AmmeMemoRadiSam system protein A [Ectothiorhodospira marina]|jgi:AmmeMemoRadiSam system protein A|uniref:AMMECR1 domain-containing protein n=1 Tax=Ectothiorhodospira marina TaxID=1396821 RepID=A0A1H7RQY3_9GAMM|nr:AmmeMemoRadiSam system protein A [Ectothiorhodospira marina]SEL62636.1 hypothetical protein SAMN05444515_1263 [Ectothiorhodospira marina]
MPSAELDAKEHRLLFQVARRALGGAQPADCTPRDLLSECLAVPAATFVTLYHRAALRGCVGTLEAQRPLVEDVAHNAWSAAFRDPRFPPLPAAQVDEVAIAISILGPSEPLMVEDEAQLHRTLRPGVDGVILSDGRHRSTFLPVVWETLPNPATFTAALRQKAGLPEDHWSDTLKLWRYTVKVLKEPAHA